jgi:hypothetical protein
MVNVDEYGRSFTPDAIAAFRERCRDVAERLGRSGSRPDDLVVHETIVAVPRKFLGIPRTAEYRPQYEVQLRGWELATVTTLQGTSGDEWFRWTVTAALGTDGLLYRVERHREERNGSPTGDDGSVSFTTLNDGDLPLFNVYDPPSFRRNAPEGYHSIFPGSLDDGLQALLA